MPVPYRLGYVVWLFSVGRNINFLGESVLTKTVFGQHRFELEEMFYILKEMQSEPTAQIVRDLGRGYEAVLSFVHELQDASGGIGEFDFHELCEADEL